MKLLQALFLLITLTFVACENDIAKVNLFATDKLPMVSQRNAELYYSDSAVIRMLLKAPLLDRYDGENAYIEMKEGVDIEFYNQYGERTTKLTANYAIKYDKTRTMEARGKVVVINEAGERLDTEELVWDETSQKIFSKDSVRITTHDKIIIGKGMEANQFFTKYRINKIKGIINIKQE